MLCLEAAPSWWSLSTSVGGGAPVFRVSGMENNGYTSFALIDPQFSAVSCNFVVHSLTIHILIGAVRYLVNCMIVSII